MANIVFADGFESGKLDLWDVVDGASVVAARAGHDGDYCLGLSNLMGCTQRFIPSVAEAYFAFRYELTDFDSSCDIMHLYKNPDETIRLYRSTASYLPRIRIGGTAVATGATALDTGKVYKIEVYVKVADVEGRVIVKVNGIVEIDFTGDTKPGADTEFNTVKLGYDVSYTCCYIDNFIMATDDWIGDVRMSALKPTADGDLLEWTASVGDRWSCIDEVPFDDLDYIYTNVVDKVNLSVAGDLPAGVYSVDYVQVQARAVFEGAPTPTKLRLALKETNVYAEGEQEVPSVAKPLYHGWNKNPRTNVAWTVGEVNSLQIGVKSIA
jgi:hypothetical protein